MASKKPSQALKHAAIERIRVAGIDANMAPLALHRYADEFLQAARCLPAATVPFSPVRCYLACRSIELALKAFLSLNGVAMAKLAVKPYGHDLAAALTSADQQGLRTMVPLANAHMDEIRRASTYYNEKVFEYPTIGEAIEGYPAKPDVAVLLSAGELLVERIREPCLNAP